MGWRRKGGGEAGQEARSRDITTPSQPKTTHCMSKWQIPQQPNVGSACARVRLQFPILYGKDGFAKKQPRNTLRKASTWLSRSVMGIMGTMGTMGTAGLSCKCVLCFWRVGNETASPRLPRTYLT